MRAWKPGTQWRRVVEKILEQDRNEDWIIDIGALLEHSHGSRTGMCPLELDCYDDTGLRQRDRWHLIKRHRYRTRKRWRQKADRRKYRVRNMISRHICWVNSQKHKTDRHRHRSVELATLLGTRGLEVESTDYWNWTEPKCRLYCANKATVSFLFCNCVWWHIRICSINPARSFIPCWFHRADPDMPSDTIAKKKKRDRE